LEILCDDDNDDDGDDLEISRNCTALCNYKSNRIIAETFL